ncbi:MAG: radical SAM protein [Candidatus Thorarchaeota archaeon]
MRYESVKAKSLLSKPIVADGWFHINRSMNAFQGCEHGCVYCDGMSESYHVDNFLTHIRIKENAAKILRRELKREGYTPQSELETETLWSFLDKEDAIRLAQKVPRKQVIGVCGGVSDGFQPAEKEHGVTRQILETLLDFRMPIFVLTKSNLVLRDLDLLKEIHKVAFANVVFTITLYDDEIRKIFEPRAASTEERFAALKETRKAGLYGGVMATPIIPGIGDSFENMRGLAKEAKKAGAEFIQFGGMTLKPGRQKEYFLNVVQRRFPEKLEMIKSIYENENRYGTPIFSRIPVNSMLRGYEICKEIGIRDRSIRHRLQYDPESNRMVLDVILDIIFRQSTILGLPWGKSKPFHELAKILERGVEDLSSLRQRGDLAEVLRLKPQMTVIVEEILDRGTCEHLIELYRKLDELVDNTKD